MSELYLETPGKAREKDAKAYLREFIDSGSEINGMGDLDKYDDYDEWLRVTKDCRLGKNLPDGYVGASEYFLIRREDDKIVGMANIRHELNDFLVRTGYGHIGYGIRPDERRKGYATAILAMALERCWELGISEVHVGCDTDNTGSKRAIKKNGGVLFRETENDGVSYLEFIIKQKAR